MKSSTISEIHALEEAMTDAIGVRGYIGWRQAGSYESGIEWVLEELERFAKTSDPSVALRLIERAMKKMESNWPKVDDSSGGMTVLFKQLQAMHHQACVRAEPDPRKLAERLFQWAMKSDYEAFRDAPKDYADVLGAAGMKKLGALIDKGFSKVPLVMPGTDSWAETGRYGLISDWAAQFAEQTGDFDKLLAVLTRNLGHTYRFLCVAEACRDFGRPDLAESWARKGLAVGEDSRLRSFLAAQYVKEGKIERAFDELWVNWQRPGDHYMEVYREIKGIGDATGFWTAWRERILESLRNKQGPADALVEVLVAEGSFQEAFDAAMLRGCSMAAWQSLAKSLEEPAALLSYLAHKRIFSIAMEDYPGYGDAGRRAAGIAVQKMKALAKRAGKGVEFTA